MKCESLDQIKELDLICNRRKHNSIDGICSSLNYHRLERGEVGQRWRKLAPAMDPSKSTEGSADVSPPVMTADLPNHGMQDDCNVPGRGSKRLVITSLPLNRQLDQCLYYFSWPEEMKATRFEISPHSLQRFSKIFCSQV